MGDPWVQQTQQWYMDTYGYRPGFLPILVNGQTGWDTMFALTRALQFELGISPLSDNFGDGTLAALTAYGSVTATNPSPAAPASNIVKIAQGALYCKGYNADNGSLSGRYNVTTQEATKALRGDLGLSSTSAELPPKLFKFLLTMEAATLLSGGSSVIRDGQRAMNGRYLARKDYYLVAADGIFLRDTHRAVMYAIQYEIGMPDGTANGLFGPGTKSGLTTNANLVAGTVDSSKIFVRLFHLMLKVNGYATTWSGSYTSTTAGFVNTFQAFAGLPVTGTGNLQTWGALLVSTGDPDRPGTAADCITTLSAEKISLLRNRGYIYFGRYLTNTPDQDPDKCLKVGEAARIIAAGGKLFPIFQTGGAEPSHFTAARGKEVAEEAAAAAIAYQIPANTVIYFTVDYDAYDWEVTDKIIPYFQAVNANLSALGRSFRVGVYGPRNVCKRVSAAGYAVLSFVSDLSTGYSGNIGQTLPTNWAFDQVQTCTEASGQNSIEIDKNIASSRAAGVTALAAATNLGADPLIPAAQKDSFEAAWFANSQTWADDDLKRTIQLPNRQSVKDAVFRHDAFIKGLAQTYSVYKALILTPMIWEGLAWTPADAAADNLVVQYYAWKAGGPAPAIMHDDSSTGLCQIFARTAIKSRNWAVSAGILTDRVYDANKWQDVWEMWQKLGDEQFNIRTAMFVMMYEANTRTLVAATAMRTLSPSQVMAALVGYNGDLVYGRRRMYLYYLIQRWHQSFR